MEHTKVHVLLREDLEWLYLPRGLTERVTDLLVGLGSRIDLTDDRADPEQNLRFVGELRHQQAAAVVISSVTTAGSSSLRPAQARRCWRAP